MHSIPRWKFLLIRSKCAKQSSLNIVRIIIWWLYLTSAKERSWCINEFVLKGFTVSQMLWIENLFFRWRCSLSVAHQAPRVAYLVSHIARLSNGNQWLERLTDWLLHAVTIFLSKYRYVLNKLSTCQWIGWIQFTSHSKWACVRWNLIPARVWEGEEESTTCLINYHSKQNTF